MSVKRTVKSVWAVYNAQGWFTGHKYDNETQATEKAKRSTGCWVDELNENEDVSQRRQPRPSNSQ